MIDIIEVDKCLDANGKEIGRGDQVRLRGTMICGPEGHMGTVLHISAVPSELNNSTISFVTVWWPVYGTISTHHWSKFVVSLNNL